MFSANSEDMNGLFCDRLKYSEPYWSKQTNDLRPQTASSHSPHTLVLIRSIPFYHIRSNGLDSLGNSSNPSQCANISIIKSAGLNRAYNKFNGHLKQTILSSANCLFLCVHFCTKKVNKAHKLLLYNRLQ